MHARSRCVRLAVPILLAAALAPGCRRAPAPPSADASSRRELTQGPVVGFADAADGHTWLGIPFARPPVGPLRWRAPLPPAPFEGELSALAFGPSCPQFAGPLGGSDGAPEGEPTGSEDCLYLNVFAPRFAPDEVPTGDERLPVMVWIHGGGNTIGSASLYDGSRLARAGHVVVVTVHYRLGVFGWLSHPALRPAGTSPEDASGNYGTLDLIRALAWVRDEIAAFGGDPGNVTIFGESAGGANVFSLLVSPAAAGLFQRAIVESGGTSTASREEAEAVADERGPRHGKSSGELLVDLMVADGRAAGREEATSRLSSMPAPEIAAWLRGLDANALLAPFAGKGFGGMYRIPDLIRDGVVLPEREIPEVLGAGDYHHVPTILGTNRDENKLFAAFASPHVGHVFGIPWRIKDHRLYALEAEYPALLWKARGVDEPAAAMRAAQGPSVFAYRFDWDDEPGFLWLDAGELMGAAHGVEIPFVFGRLRFFGATPMFDDARHDHDMALSHAMQSYWTRFAATGDPGQGLAGDLPAWQAWSQGRGHKYVILDSPDDRGIRMGSEAETRAEVIARVATDERFHSMDERCAVWGSFVVYSDELSEEEYRSLADGACRDVPLPGA